MKRKIIEIDDSLCNGCGNCIPGCPEGALQVIDGKARLISDLFCDGLGACLGECPLGAIQVIEREAEPYSEARVMENIVKQGAATVRAHLEHLRDHNETVFLAEAVSFLNEKKFALPAGFETTKKAVRAAGAGCACPGSATVDLSSGAASAGPSVSAFQASRLENWPVQLKLINPGAPFFKNADLLIAADCAAFSHAGFHEKFLRGKKLIILCPKLDDGIDGYVDKLTELFSTQDLRSLSIVHMEVPCCFGIEKIVMEALRRAKVSLPVKEYTVSIKGEVV